MKKVYIFASDIKLIDMAKFNFVLNNKPSKSGKYAVMLRITIKKDRAFMVSGVELKSPNNFLPDGKNDSWVHSKESDYKQMNKKLKEVKDAAFNTYNQLVGLHEVVTPNMVIEQMKPKTPDVDKESFLKYVETRIEKIKNGELLKDGHGGKYGYRTYIKYNDFLNKLQAFLKDTGKKDLLFVEINRKTIADFEAFLLGMGNAIEKNKMLNPNTITKEMKVFRALVNKAIEDGKIEAGNNPFIGKKYAETPSEKERLNLQEISMIEALPLEEGSLIWNCRNAFLFSFYCAGIRAGDLLQLRWCNITSDGRLNYQMEKSNKQEDMMLVEQAADILKQYRNSNSNSTDYIFPFLKNGKPYASAITNREKETLAPELNQRRLGDIASCNAILNLKLKDIAEMAGIEKKVTMHISRHSFAGMAKQAGTDNLHLKKLMGHSSIKVTETYMGSFDTKKTDEALQHIFSKKEEATDKEKLMAILEGMDSEQITSLLATIQKKA